VPRDHFSKLAEILAKHPNLYHGGIEFLFQLFINAIGSVHISSTPFLLRDFTYINYTYDVMREAPTTDKYPYHGIEAINIASDLIRYFSPEISIDSGLAEQLISNVIFFGSSLQGTRTMVGNSIDKNSFLVEHMKNLQQVIDRPSSLSVAHKVWLMTSALCYPSIKA
jgi:hypothetical protein